MSAAAASAPGEPAAAGWVLLLPALVVLWNEVRGRGATLIGIGVWGTVLGVLGYVGGSVLNLVTRAVAPSAQGLEAFTRIQDDGLLVGVVVLPIQLGLVALVVLLAGVARARLGRWWLPVAGAVAVVADQVTAEVENPLVLAAAFLPMAAALVAVGARLLGSATTPAPVQVPA